MDYQCHWWIVCKYRESTSACVLRVSKWSFLNFHILPLPRAATIWYSSYMVFWVFFPNYSPNTKNFTSDENADVEKRWFCFVGMVGIKRPQPSQIWSQPSKTWWQRPHAWSLPFRLPIIGISPERVVNKIKRNGNCQIVMEIVKLSNCHGFKAGCQRRVRCARKTRQFLIVNWKSSSWVAVFNDVKVLIMETDVLKSVG